MSSANSAHLFESIGSLGVIQLVFFAMFLNNHYWQVIILMASIVGFFAYLNHVFYSRRVGQNAGIAVVISQLFVLIEELAFVRTEMGQASLVGAAIEMTLFSAVPYGRSCTAV
jgi:sterol desaturase/sphingolipid hydroxylase (fatty acid hydroxylase superfamily)